MFDFNQKKGEDYQNGTNHFSSITQEKYSYSELIIDIILFFDIHILINRNIPGYFKCFQVNRSFNSTQCSLQNRLFLYPQQYARGDPECFFYCGYDQMKRNANGLPGTYTLALAIDIGLDWTKEVSKLSDMENLVTRATGNGKNLSKIHLSRNGS